MKSKKVGIIDYGAGNLGSIYNSMRYLNTEAKVLYTPKDLDQFSHLILPGVGSFGKLAENLSRKNWPENIQDFVRKGKNLLGICVGMQLLFESSEESKNSKGLSLIKGKFRLFDDSFNLPIPHMGFNEVNHSNTEIWKGIKNKSPFYFIHSFKVKNTDDKTILSKTFYGEEFISFVEKENIFGSQFHPEKSHLVGLKLLKNFLEINN